MTLQVLGWIATACFMLCVIPQTIACIRAKSAGTLTWAFLVMWFMGCMTGAVYVAARSDWPLLANYLFGLANIGVIGHFKVKDTRNACQSKN